jgi:predicted transcriptional regulator
MFILWGVVTLTKQSPSQLEQLVRKRQGRKPSILDGSLTISGIQHILGMCTTPVRYGTLDMHRKIAYKKSFFKYLHYCVEKGFLEKSGDGGINGMTYHITHSGRQFLELVQ